MHNCAQHFPTWPEFPVYMWNSVPLMLCKLGGVTLCNHATLWLLSKETAHNNHFVNRVWCATYKQPFAWWIILRRHKNVVYIWFFAPFSRHWDGVVDWYLPLWTTRSVYPTQLIYHDAVAWYRSVLAWYSDFSSADVKILSTLLKIFNCI